MPNAHDRLKPLGAGAGVLVALIGAATVVGTPWAYNRPTAAGIQVVGAVLAVAIGAGLVWLATQAE